MQTIQARKEDVESVNNHMPIRIYAQPAGWMLAEIVLFPILWGLLTSLASRKSANKILDAVLLLVAIYAILQITLLTRSAAERVGFFSPPFNLLQKAWSENREIFRSLFLNVLLFEPMGAALVHLLLDKWSWRVRTLFTVLVGLTASLSIEYCQFRFFLGNAEADDVICNTLGALIGALSLPIKECFDRHRGWLSIRRNQCQKNVTERNNNTVK